MANLITYYLYGEMLATRQGAEKYFRNYFNGGLSLFWRGFTLPQFY